MMTRLLLVISTLTFSCAGLLADTNRTRAPRTAERIHRLSATVEDPIVATESFLADLSESDIVYLAEVHDQASHHVMQASIIEALHHANPQIVIALEMVEEPYQATLDEWVAGRIDEANLLAGIEWQSRWGFDFAMYRPIFRLARTEQIPMLAAAPRKELVRRVARDGFSSLSGAEQEELPTLDLSNAQYRARIIEQTAGHHGNPDYLFEAQVLRDEFMARSISNAAEAARGPVVVLAGRGHIESHFGIPSRAAHRRAGAFRSVVAAIDESDELESLLASDPPMFDYVWVVAAE